MNIKSLYYITHINNLLSISSKGILSRERITEEGVHHRSIANLGIVNSRKKKFTSDNRSLWYYVNLFIQPHNKMLRNVINAYDMQNIAVLCISNSILQRIGVFLTVGNAAATRTQILPLSEGLQALQARGERVVDILQSENGFHLMMPK